jgi:predicted benzoate:H+ symporter BenE
MTTLPLVFPVLAPSPDVLTTLASAGPMPLAVALLAAVLIGFGVAGHRTP